MTPDDFKDAKKNAAKLMNLIDLKIAQIQAEGEILLDNAIIPKLHEMLKGVPKDMLSDFCEIIKFVHCMGIEFALLKLISLDDEHGTMVRALLSSGLDLHDKYSGKYK